MAMSTLLTPDEAATYLKYQVKTLANLRSMGGGPPYLKRRGRIFYRTEDLDSWLAACARRHTSDPGGQQHA